MKKALVLLLTGMLTISTFTACGSSSSESTSSLNHLQNSQNLLKKAPQMKALLSLHLKQNLLKYLKLKVPSLKRLFPMVHTMLISIPTALCSKQMKNIIMERAH